MHKFQGLNKNERQLLMGFCADLGLEFEKVIQTSALEGSPQTWRGPIDVNALASTTVLLATYLTQQFWRLRGQPPQPVIINREHAALAFLTEGLTDPQGWKLPGSWDSIAGDYRCEGGWIRLHTNYAHHRLAALSALQLDTDVSREQVSERIRHIPGQELEDRIVANHGIAGLQRTPQEWQAHAQARALSPLPLIIIDSTPAPTSSPNRWVQGASLPFSGIRVLDLTRVLAGPVATGLLAAWGADVLRIDPPGFDEVPGLVPITLAGKRSIRLDLKTDAGLSTLQQLLTTADILVHGYRDSALANLGLKPARLKQINPNLINVRLNAYGHTGPWQDRRGFDSIVQHSTGITHIGQQAFAADKPVPLACQALDYGTGWLMAACAAHGLLQLGSNKVANSYALSLAGTGDALLHLPERIDHLIERPTAPVIAAHSVTAKTFCGLLTRIGWPGRIGKTSPVLGYAPAIGSADAPSAGVKWLV